MNIPINLFMWGMAILPIIVLLILLIKCQEYKIKKHNGNYRTIYSPNPLLKDIQRKETILKNIKDYLEVD